MFVISFLSLVALAAAGSAPPGHEFQEPGPGDVRSPCPGLNSLANHGFINRNGKALSVPILINGIQEGLNVGADFSTVAGTAALFSTPTGLATTFDLDNLDEHNFPIEHDASLSREDAYFGNDHSFNQTIFNQVLAFYKGVDTVTIDLATKARYARVKNSLAIDPDVVYGPREAVISYGETAIYLSVLGNPTTGDAPLSYVKMFFENETLPYELGWTKPAQETNLVTLGIMIAKLGAANPDAVPEGLVLGKGTLQDVYEQINPITGKLENATCIIAGTC